MAAEKINYSRAEIVAYYSERVPEMRQVGSKGWRGPCPVHHGERDSFSVDAATGRWYCHSECKRGGSIVSLEKQITGTSYKRARQKVLRIVGRAWRRVATYVYTDESRKPLFRVIRRERGRGAEREKAFHQERFERECWLKGLGAAPRVPYRLHRIVNAKRVVIVEGEKDCDAIRRKLKLVATTNPMGAGNWSSEYNRYLAGKHVTIIPDNDSSGRVHALRVAEALLSCAASVRVLELPGLPEKGDITDWVQNGGTREELEALRKTALRLDRPHLTRLRKQWGLEKSRPAPRFPFEVNDQGVFLKRDDQEEPAKISARVDVIAETRDVAGKNWGRLLQWKDNEDRVHQWAMPMELLATNSGAVRAQLQSEGLPFVTTNSRLRERFTEYLQTEYVDRRVRCVGRVGWNGETYVLPDCAIGPKGSEEVLYQTTHEGAHQLNIRGTADDWRNHIGLRCSGNSRLIVAVSCAFTGPLVSVAGAESGGIHFHGATSTGKSTALVVGGSVCGGGGPAGFVQTWRATLNGLEAVAEAHNDGTLFLDELSQLDAREGGETAYLLGNGQGKTRMTRVVGLRRKLTWNLIYVSAGELTLAEHALSAGKRTRGGAAVRLLNITADAGAGMGMFENLHGVRSADAFARRMKRMALKYYGSPLRVWLEFLTKDRVAATDAVKRFQSEFMDKYLQTGSAGEVSRAAQRFGLIGAAGELASEAGLTGWAKGESIKAAGQCFRSWVETRGTTGGADIEAAIQQIRRFLEANGSSRFQTLPGPSFASREEKVPNRAGFRRTREGSTQYLLLPEAFRKEVCSGYDYRVVLKELDARGFLVRTPPDFTIKPRLPELGIVRVYCIRAAILKGKE